MEIQVGQESTINMGEDVIPREQMGGKKDDLGKPKSKDAGTGELIPHPGCD